MTDIFLFACDNSSVTFIKITVREALSLTRVDNIMNVVKGRQKTAYGYVWRKKF